jgi:hypothetical protein
MVGLWNAIGLLSFLAYKVSSQQIWVNLPDVPEGFNASVRTEINATVQAVWDATLDWPSYPSWNPFVRQVCSKKMHFHLIALSRIRNRNSIRDRKRKSDQC